MRRFCSVTTLLVPVSAAACAIGASQPWSAAVLRPAQDTPIQFVTEDGIQPASGCRSPLIDPRDQTRIRLVRSAAVGRSGRGDYEVPGHRYDVGSGELLRIECSTGQALGIVAN